MTKLIWALASLVVWFGIALIADTPVAAQALPAKPTITFDSFNGIYHLSRDAQNHSLLTTEEVILADFPGSSSFYGISRTIPKTYQGHSVAVKILNVTDKAGSPMPYKTSTDKNGNLVVTTGDPAITLYGFQTIKITYQTRDVVNLDLANDQFLLDVNGRGWDQSLGAVTASVFIPKSFASSLLSEPSCYIGYLNTTLSGCSVSTKVQADSTEVDAKALGALAPSHGLVVKLNFRPATFAKTSKTDHWAVIVGAAAVAGPLLFVWRWTRTS